MKKIPTKRLKMSKKIKKKAFYLVVGKKTPI